MRNPAAAKKFIRIALVLACILNVDSALAREIPLEFSPQLPVSPAMAERVRFWIDVFTRVSHTEAVLHDRDDPTLVYDVVPYGLGGDTTQIDATRASYERLLSEMTTEGIFHSLTPP